MSEFLACKQDLDDAVDLDDDDYASSLWDDVDMHCGREAAASGGRNGDCRRSGGVDFAAHALKMLSVQIREYITNK